ncbi:MAG: acyl-CoA thioesterase II [Chloroflexota bacterium]
METIQELAVLLDLERIEADIFRGQNYKAPWKRVFGGQPLAQSLHAAYQTVPEGRFAHSMHAYFILPGDIEVPIVYEVHRIRDGGSFTTRRVVAIQKGQAIFSMSASFQKEEEGLDHQIAMPNVPPPENLITDQELAESYREKAPKLYKRAQTPRPIEFRPVEKLDWLNPHKHQPLKHTWIKAKGTLPDDKQLHHTTLAYASDFTLLSTALLPHWDQVEPNGLIMASIDHGMWFHRDFRMDEWLLYAMDSPSASNARGFNRGSIFTRDGNLVASVVQEGLMRKRRK